MIGVIKALAESDKMAFKSHAILRMNEREIKADDVKFALLNAVIIEKYTDDKPLTSYLLLGQKTDKSFLHMVVAIDKKLSILWIITVYKPTIGRWEEGFKIRRT